jgi:HD-GYP domain-containing protein (c-di-GMP phosphodiesterase class II)
MEDRYVASQIVLNAYAENIAKAKNNEITRWLLHKVKHTFEVCGVLNDILLAEKLEFTARDQNNIICAAVLHDLGRFYQHDGERIISLDHGAEGVKRLQLLNQFTDSVILFAIAEHNKYRINEANLPAENSQVAMSAAKLVRDADKLANLKDFLMNGLPGFFSDGRGLSDKVRGLIRDDCDILFSDISTNADHVVSLLMWFNDMNFNYTRLCCERIGFFEQALATLKTLNVSDEDIKLIRCWCKKKF